MQIAAEISTNHLSTDGYPFLLNQSEIRTFKQGNWLSCSCLLVAQHPSNRPNVPQEKVCEYNLTCSHTETKDADQTCCLIFSKHADTEPTGPGAGPVMPGLGQGSHLSTSFIVTSRTWFGVKPVWLVTAPTLTTNALTTQPSRQSANRGWMPITAEEQQEPMLKWLMFTILTKISLQLSLLHNQPLRMFGLLHAISQQNDCSCSSLW